MNFVPFQRLGAGGYGDVWLARRSDTQEVVVVKYLRDAHVAEYRRAFEREVRILEKGIRGVVTLIAKNTLCDRPFYAMPYFPGGTLAAWAGRLDPDQLLVVARDLTIVLSDLHRRLTYHGDLKPDNLLLGSDGRARIADPLGNGWGCTVLFSNHHGGTPGYWAPEVARGGRISAAGDIFSLGATIYHLATGIVPKDGVPFHPTLLRGDALTPIRRAVRACLTLDPSSRPSAGDVLRILNGESWEAIQQGREELVRGVLAVGGVIGLAALVVSAFGEAGQA